MKQNTKRSTTWSTWLWDNLVKELNALSWQRHFRGSSKPWTFKDAVQFWTHVVLAVGIDEPRRTTYSTSILEDRRAPARTVTTTECGQKKRSSVHKAEIISSPQHWKYFLEACVQPSPLSIFSKEGGRLYTTQAMSNSHIKLSFLFIWNWNDEHIDTQS